MFEVAVYTDARADEAVDGLDGFNFVAMSPGVTAQDRQVIRDRMLHRVVSGWGLDHDPLDHPPTFAYVKRGERHYLARGVSTGLTTNGRPGNMITHTVATSDTDDFGSMRPAQLFGALRWSMSRTSSQHVEPWPGPLEVDQQFSVTSLSSMVLDDEWAIAQLPNFITMVEDLLSTTPKRLIIVATDAVAAQRWIALGTLFIDALSAQELSIRGMVADPMTTSGDIVAASPEFGPQPEATTARTGVNIIDLDRRQMSPVQPSSSAIVQADWFLNQDCLSALSAMELARSWQRHLGDELSTNGAAVAAELSVQCGIERWRTAMRTILGLAEHQLEYDLLMYADVLLDALVAHHPSTSEDAELAAQATMALLRLGPADPAQCALSILMHTLEWIGSPERARTWLRSIASVPPVTTPQWNDPSEHHQACALISQLPPLLTPDSLPDLFVAVDTFALNLTEPGLGASGRALGDHWARHPELSAERHRWAHRQTLYQELQASLLRAWSDETGPAVDALRDGHWDWLEIEGTDQTRDWVRAGQIARQPLEDRPTLLSGTRVPAESCLLIWGSAPLTRSVAMLSQWVRTMPLPPVACQRILEETKQHSSRGTAYQLRTLMLAIDGTLTGTPPLAGLARRIAAAERTVSTVLRTPVFGNRATKDLARILPELTPWFIDQLGQLVIAADSSVRAELIEADAKGIASATRQEVTRLLVGPNPRSSVLTALKLIEAPEPEISRPARAALKEYLNSPQKSLAVREIRSGLDKQQRARLAEIEEVSALRKVGRYLRDPRR